MSTPLLQGVDIQEDLSIPLSYDAAWKIFNRWPQEVRVQHKPLGQKKMPAKQQAFCFCAQKNCNTRCPFFGLCKKGEGSTEEKLQGIMSHTEGERDETPYKDLLDSLNKWYNTRCAAGSSQVLDLSKLEQLKIKYKMPAYSVCRTNCSSRRRREYKSTFYYKNEHAAHDKPASDASSSGKRKKRSKTSDLMDSSELYYTIEDQLRNLSVSQSRLKQMSVSLCRLAYAKQLGSVTKLKPKVYKRRVCKNHYRYDIPIASNSTSDSCGNTGAAKVTVNERKKCSKLSKKCKAAKSSDSSKSGKTSDSSKSSKSTSQTAKSKSSKRSKASKTSKTSESSKATKSSRTTESSKATKSSGTTESSRTTKSSRTTESDKTSGSSKTGESNKTCPSNKRSRGGRTSDSSKTSRSYKSSKSTKSARFSRNSETSKMKGSAGISKIGRQKGKSSGSGRSSETSKTTDISKTSDSNTTGSENVEMNKSFETHSSLETGHSELDTAEILESNQNIITSPSQYTTTSPQIDSGGFTNANADDISEHSKNKRTKHTNKTTKSHETHSIIKSLRFEFEKINKKQSVRKADTAEARSKLYRGVKMQKELPKVTKPPIPRLGGGLGAYGRRSSGSIETSHRYGAIVNRKWLPKAPTKYTPTESITPQMRLAKSSLKRDMACAAGNIGDDLQFRNKRKVVRKPSVRISKPILALFGKKRTPSKQVMALCGGRSRCFLIKGGR